MEMERQEKWDRRFLDMAKMVAGWSKDPSTKSGAVIVRPDLSVASVGFNGFPKSMSDADELYEDRETKYSRVVHCEINALIHAGERVDMYTLYTFPFMCCDRCVVQMIQAGISRFVWPVASTDAKSRWSESFLKTEKYIGESGAAWSEYGSATHIRAVK